MKRYSRVYFKIFWIDALALSLAVVYAPLVFMARGEVIGSVALTALAATFWAWTKGGERPFSIHNRFYLEKMGLSLLFQIGLVTFYSLATYLIFHLKEMPFSQWAAVIATLVIFKALGKHIYRKPSLRSTADINWHEDSAPFQVIGAALFITLINGLLLK